MDIHNRNAEADGEQMKEVLPWQYFLDCLHTQGDRRRVCLFLTAEGITTTCALIFVQCHAGVLQALQLKQPAAAK